MSELAPLHGDDSCSDVNTYIVVFKDDVSVEAAMAQIRGIVVGEGNQLRNEMNIGKFHAFSAEMTKEVRDRVRGLPSVKYVEVDQVVSIPPGEVN